MITPPPVLDCCAKEEMVKSGQQAYLHKWSHEKIPKIYEQVANETGAKLINLFDLYKNKPESELCANQVKSIEKHEGLPNNFCDAIHWGRPEIVSAINTTLLQPEASFIAQEKVLEKSILTGA